MPVSLMERAREEYRQIKQNKRIKRNIDGYSYILRRERSRLERFNRLMACIKHIRETLIPINVQQVSLLELSNVIDCAESIVLKDMRAVGLLTVTYGISLPIGRLLVLEDYIKGQQIKYAQKHHNNRRNSKGYSKWSSKRGKFGRPKYKFKHKPANK